MVLASLDGFSSSLGPCLILYDLTRIIALFQYQERWQVHCLDRICDAVEVAGKNVMSTSSTVTTELVNQRYGEKAAEATNEGLGAAGHAVGTAWAVFKLRQALNPKSVFKPSKLAKAAAEAAAAEVKGKSSE